MSSFHGYTALQGGAHVDVQLSDKVEEQEAFGDSKEQLRPTPLQLHSWCGQFAVPGSSFSGEYVGAKSLNTHQLQVRELQATYKGLVTCVHVQLTASTALLASCKAVSRPPITASRAIGISGHWCCSGMPWAQVCSQTAHMNRHASILHLHEQR